MKRYCLTLDLIDDPDLIREYEEHHKMIWPDVEKSILDSGILNMEIYRFASRLFMIIEASDDFSFEKKGDMDLANPVVQQWEDLMWKYQKPLPGSGPGEKWKMMEKIFDLKNPDG